ncbi:hypothetical protein PBI_GRAYSON_223 [Rhodococcus phage Grayson]|jgi:hypothetical protein|nr:hypothetical protein PBI_GRAYSON_223 [Rhodococcus phage Grayson]
MDRVYVIMAQSKINSAIKDIIAVFENRQAALDKVDQLKAVEYSLDHMDFYVEGMRLIKSV